MLISISTQHIDAKPLKPSMMLTELANPATMKMVSAAAQIGNDTTQSKPGTSVRRITPSTATTASPADKAVKNKRRWGLCVLVRSSVKPEPKAGTAHSSSSTALPAMSGWRSSITNNAASTPIRMPKPPTRGTGAE